MKAYPEYKDSGVPWLGKVPKHWVEKPGLALLKEKQIKNTGLKEDIVLSLSYGRIVIKPKDKLRGLVPESFETYQIVEPGDIIIRSTDLQNDKTSLRVGKVKNKGIITSAYICLKPNENIYGDFAHLLLHGLDIKKVFYGLGSGLRQNLSWVDFKRMPFFMPSTEEQHQITRFLDYKTYQINKFIRAKKRIIELLKEQKQCIINDAVTGKIDVRTGKPYPKYKDSGVEWLGQVPEGWEVKRIKEIATIFGRIGFRGYKQSDIVGEGEGAITLSPSNIKDNQLCLDKLVYLSWEKYNESEEIMVYPGDIIIVKTGSSFGKSAIINEYPTKMTINPQLIILKKISLKNEYLHLVLTSKIFINQVNQMIIGGATPTIGQSVMGAIKIILPPNIEYELILKHVSEKTKNANLAIYRIEREISLMQEYRTRLIADVVTGKVDVRGIEVPDVPEEEAEALEVSGDDDVGDEDSSELVETEE